MSVGCSLRFSSGLIPTATSDFLVGVPAVFFVRFAGLKMLHASGPSMT